MRSLLCALLSLALICSLICAGSSPLPASPPAGRPAAWWGLLFPGFFGLDGEESVTFSWPVIEYVKGWFCRA